MTINLLDLVDCADVRMVQGRGSPGLAAKAFQCLGIVGEFLGKELQGHVPTELDVFRLVHHAHASAANPADDAVMGDRLSGWLRWHYHWRK